MQAADSSSTWWITVVPAAVALVGLVAAGLKRWTRDWPRLRVSHPCVTFCECTASRFVCWTTLITHGPPSVDVEIRASVQPGASTHEPDPLSVGIAGDTQRSSGPDSLSLAVTDPESPTPLVITGNCSLFDYGSACMFSERLPGPWAHGFHTRYLEIRLGHPRPGWIRRRITHRYRWNTGDEEPALVKVTGLWPLRRAMHTVARPVNRFRRWHGLRRIDREDSAEGTS